MTGAESLPFAGLAPWQVAFLGLVSLGVGVLGGFVGLALGSLRLPFLLFLGLPLPVAGGTNTLVSVSGALSGALRHLREGRVDWGAVPALGVPSVTGGFLGGYFSGRAPEAPLLALLGLYLLWEGQRLLHRSSRPADPGPGASLRRRHPLGWAFLAGAIGLGVGALGGALGLIMGAMRLPLLVGPLGLDPRKVPGTNLLVGLAVGASGFAGHALRGEWDPLLLGVLGGTALVGAQIGARLTGRASVPTLLRAMGLTLLLLGSTLLLRAVGGLLASAP